MTFCVVTRPSSYFVKNLLKRTLLKNNKTQYSKGPNRQGDIYFFQDFLVKMVYKIRAKTQFQRKLVGNLTIIGG